MYAKRKKKKQNVYCYIPITVTIVMRNCLFFNSKESVQCRLLYCILDFLLVFGVEVHFKFNGNTVINTNLRESCVFTQ